MPFSSPANAIATATTTTTPTTAPSVMSSCSSTTSSSRRRRSLRNDDEEEPQGRAQQPRGSKKNKKNVLKQLACLWKSPVGPSEKEQDHDSKPQMRKPTPRMFSSTSTFLGEEEEEEEEDHDDDEEWQDELEDDKATFSQHEHEQQQPQQQRQDDDDDDDVSVPPPLPDETAPPTEWLRYYAHRLRHATEDDDWTERANLYYAVGNCHVRLRHHGAATEAFEREAALLRRHGAPGEALAAVYRSLGRLWTVPGPARALSYYRTALEHCRDAGTNTSSAEAREIRHAMGRLYFQTGDLERAVQVSIGHGALPK